MAASTPNTIILKGSPPRDEGALASGQTITPGRLINNAATGVALHAVAGGPAVPLFAVEDPYGTATPAIDTAYSSSTNQVVRYAMCRAGDEVYGWMNPGGTVAVGTYLQSDGAGGFEAHVAGSAAIVQVIEQVTGTVDARVKLRVL